MEFLKMWPAWIGTPAQIVMIVVVLGTLIKTWPIIQKQVFEARFAREGRYGQRIAYLEKELAKCHAECTENISKLNSVIYGMRTQRNAEQAALLRAILQTIDSPELRKQLEMLEALQMTILPVELNGPVEDGGY